MTSMTDDIITVIARLSTGFKSLQLEPPEAIVLKSHDDGMRLWVELNAKMAPILHTTYQPGQEPGVVPIEGENGAVYMELEVYGMKVRWPAKKWATPDSRWRYG